MLKTEDRVVTLRRSLEQVRHCVDEALSVVDRGEDPRCAADDVLAALDLLRGKVTNDLSELIHTKLRASEDPAVWERGVADSGGSLLPDDGFARGKTFVCSVCRLSTVESPSGRVCPSGHGGTEVVASSETETD